MGKKKLFCLKITLRTAQKRIKTLLFLNFLKPDNLRLLCPKNKSKIFSLRKKSKALKKT